MSGIDATWIKHYAWVHPRNAVGFAADCAKLACDANADTWDQRGRLLRLRVVALAEKFARTGAMDQLTPKRQLQTVAGYGGPCGGLAQLLMLIQPTNAALVRDAHRLIDAAQFVALCANRDGATEADVDLARWRWIAHDLAHGRALCRETHQAVVAALAAGHVDLAYEIARTP